ncbi:DUF6250 domain-containing protein [Alkalitalea saponilacus]|uniref:Farnesoic acid 0-methyl transferase n=1 Tax=Alkalitalea saponilacus TaxID=889453 RepID=A0A1T5D3P0_9BACT|nr:DUF6250 domain-containing protein [Alkalitalea saponilacus]ASB50567.1 methyltransferase [Alkalitalea saponilacus]SKB66368.1 Farnesoic acid 0-methyl transferase [Alkalitalea saponilacus]
MKQVSTILSILLIIALSSCGGSSSSVNITKELIFSDDFSNGLNKMKWVVEIDSTPQSRVYVENGQLITDTEGGVTVWLNKELSGNYIIEYQRTVMVEDGINDRLSDLNQFWMASDPNNENLFTRSGKFEEYDDLSQYYVGVGGNYNTTTRFRKYDGYGERIIIEEKNEPPYLLEANTTYNVKIKVNNGNISFWMNDLCYFEYEDSEPLTSGYFGFRSTWSRHHIDFINIYKIH